jgi:transcriptional regulator with XRE-family HTH domain
MSSQQFEAFMGRVARGTGIQSQSELAVALDVNRSAVSRAKSRDRVPEQWISRLCALFDRKRPIRYTYRAWSGYGKACLISSRPNVQRI